MVGDTALVKKPALARMKRIHEEVAQMGNEVDGGDDLNRVRPTQNWLAHQTDRGPLDGTLNTDTKSSWASLFGSSSEGSLPYTPPQIVGDKIVVVPSEELEEGEISSSPNRPSRQMEKEVGKRDEFAIVTHKKRELVSVRDRGKSLEVDGGHNRCLNEKVHNAKEAMDRAQKEVDRNPTSDILSRQVVLETEVFWTAVKLEEASLRQKLTSHDGVVQLAAPINHEEVKKVLFSMNSGKNPGPDGFSIGFFKGVQATAITLISKRYGTERMEEFRPISCCNELVVGYHLNVGKPHCTLKVDLQKAYDSVHLDFLFGLLITIGTPLRKGLRQTSTYFLFVNVMEVLSRMLNKPLQSFHFHQQCEKVSLTHLTIVDDLMIFCVTDEPSLSFVRETLQKFVSFQMLVWVLPLGTYLFAILDFLYYLVGYVLMIMLLLFNVLLVGFDLGLLEFYLFLVDKILRSYLSRGKEEGRRDVKVAWAESGVGRSWCLGLSCISGIVWNNIFGWRWGMAGGVKYGLNRGYRGAVNPCLSVMDRWVWVPGRQGGFLIASAWDFIRPRGGRIYCGVGGMSLSIPFMCGWPLKIGGVESRDHLFFFVSFQGDIWSRVLQVMVSSYRISARAVSWREDAQILI
ncbi:putative reverse transcriptase [Cucumis melo var. makuwa]|uniref:Reverse transcriptase n=1 Tax=Cucumis melo var. makuwa TaxID=1194695 RepID=A0A5D3D4N0_CUCMM|nr:putative reverse transcriptase [Cucumis melo var. makuwa]TYK18505.1 putative reverse transcriptase [Cucumis melo var. makuwa]